MEPEGGTSPYEVRFTCALPVPGGVSRETIVIDPRQDDGTIGRLINHACPPADNLQPKWGFVAGRPRIWFEAKQIIRKNQQFAWTYGERLLLYWPRIPGSEIIASYLQSPLRESKPHPQQQPESPSMGAAGGSSSQRRPEPQDDTLAKLGCRIIVFPR